MEDAKRGQETGGKDKMQDAGGRKKNSEITNSKHEENPKFKNKMITPYENILLGSKRRAFL